MKCNGNGRRNYSKMQNSLAWEIVMTSDIYSTNSYPYYAPRLGVNEKPILGILAL